MWYSALQVRCLRPLSHRSLPFVERANYVVRVITLGDVETATVIEVNLVLRSMTAVTPNSSHHATYQGLQLFLGKLVLVNLLVAFFPR